MVIAGDARGRDFASGGPAMKTTTFTAHVPVSLVCPPLMESAFRYVFEGEYESGFDGRGLDILDIGANVGAFARWADIRYPGSVIRCFEPNPGTFGMLMTNIAGFTNISATNAALYPGVEKRARFFARYDGDGEGGLMAYAGDTFTADAMRGGSYEVDVIDPATVPSADLVKIDVEGAEGAILSRLDLSKTCLVLGEFQNGRNRAVMQEVLRDAGFDAVIDDAVPWDPILDYRDYRQDLKGDVYGRMVYVRRGQTRLTRRA
jgi:FkbM family methyltransferase